MNETNEDIMLKWCKDHPEESKYHVELIALAREQDRVNNQLESERLKQVFQTKRNLK
jgi:hypothetical protein